MALTTVIAANPIKVSGTVGAGGTGAATIYTGDIFVERIYWVNPTTNAHDVTVLESGSGGKEVAYLYCHTNGIGITQERVVNGHYNNLYISTMDSGTLYIYRK